MGWLWSCIGMVWSTLYGCCSTTMLPALCINCYDDRIGVALLWAAAFLFALFTNKTLLGPPSICSANKDIGCCDNCCICKSGYPLIIEFWLFKNRGISSSRFCREERMPSWGAWGDVVDSYAVVNWRGGNLVDVKVAVFWRENEVDVRGDFFNSDCVLFFFASDSILSDSVFSGRRFAVPKVDLLDIFYC